MADSPSHFEIIRQLEQLRKQYGFATITELLNDMGSIYAAAVTGLPKAGTERLERQVESINLWNMAAEAAEEGQALGVIEGQLGDDHFELISLIVPGSLVEIRNEALERIERESPPVTMQAANEIANVPG